MKSEQTVRSETTQDALFHLMADRIPGVVWSVDTDLRFTWSFGAGLESLGLHPSEVVGRTLFEYFQTDDNDLPVISAHRRALLGESMEYQESWLGRIYHVHVERLTDGDGQVIGCIGFAHDVTRQSQAQDELERKVDERTVELQKASKAIQENRDQLQAIYNGVVDGLLIVDIQRRHAVQMNAAMCRMLGYSQSELKLVPVAGLHPEEYAAEANEHFREHASGLRSRSDNMPMLRKDGTVFYADIASSPILYDGRPCLLSFFRDVTQRRQAEATLRRETQTLKKLLLASDHERQVIAYEIHDTLAQWIVGATMQFEAFERLKEDQPDRAVEAFQEGMGVLRQCQQRARDLIRGVRPITLDQMGVAGVIAHLVQGRQEQQKHRIELHIDVKFDRLEPVQENSIHRIVQEALRNACKHSGSDRIRIEIVQDGQQLQIVVQDWGVGFDLQEIGEYQFGLDGIRVRARLLGGQADIQSEPGIGTCITVRMPIAKRDTDE